MTRTRIALVALLLSAAGLGCGGDGLPYAPVYAYAHPFAGGKIYAVPQGGGAPVLLVAGQVFEEIASAFAFDGTTAYYSDVVDSTTSVYLPPVASLRSVPVMGGTPTTLVTGVDSVASLVVDDQNLYFIDTPFDASPDYSTSFIGKAPLGGGAFEKLVANPIAEPTALAVAAGSLYWSDQSGAVNRIATEGGYVETLASNQGRIGNISVDSSGVYWTNVGQTSVDCGASGGSVAALVSGSTQPTTLVDMLDNVDSIAVLGGSVYFSFSGEVQCNTFTSANGEVAVTAPGTMPGTAPASSLPLATGLAGPSNLYLGADTLYYTTVTDAENYTLAPHAIGLGGYL